MFHHVHEQDPSGHRQDEVLADDALSLDIDLRGPHPALQRTLEERVEAFLAEHPDAPSEHLDLILAPPIRVRGDSVPANAWDDPMDPLRTVYIALYWEDEARDDADGPSCMDGIGACP